MTKVMYLFAVVELSLQKKRDKWAAEKKSIEEKEIMERKLKARAQVNAYKILFTHLYKSAVYFQAFCICAMGLSRGIQTMAHQPNLAHHPVIIGPHESLKM